MHSIVIQAEDLLIVRSAVTAKEAKILFKAIDPRQSTIGVCDR
jgi:hypothetical protein